ncbi:MAG TPA: DUF5676 family membrane protein [Gemmatimonadales bacterium]|nr:DUF5676 family membrane protein [Gemmatimonadales bacterium]
MRLDARAFGIATGIVAAVLFSICALAVAAAPGPTTALAGYLVHTDLTGIARAVTFGNFLGGLVIWTVGTAVAFGSAVGIYNRLIPRAFTAAAMPAHAEPQHG